MEQGFILYPDFDITKAEAKINKLQRDYDDAKKDIENKKIELDLTSENIEKTKSKITKLKSELEEIRKANQESFLTGTFIKEDAAAYDKKKAELEKQIDLLKKQQSIYRKQELSLERQKTKTANIGDQILLNSKKQTKFSKAFEKSQKSADRFGRRLKSLIASALFFSVVTKAFTALRNEFGKLITETGTKTADLVAQLNGSLSVLGRTLYEGTRPYIEMMLQGLIKMVNILAQGLAKILGKDINQMKKLAQQTKKAGEEAKKATAGFDTLQTIDTSSDSNNGVNAELNDGISNEIALLMGIISGALLVLGVILTFTGVNIPLGLGLIAAGAAGLATSIAANWDTMSTRTQNSIDGVLGLGGGLFILLGLALILTGAGIPLGIGLILLGAGMLYGAYQLAPGDDFVEKVTNLWKNVKSITKEFLDWWTANVIDKVFGKGMSNSLKDYYSSIFDLFEDIIFFYKSVFTGDWKNIWRAWLNIFVDALNLVTSGINTTIQSFLGGGSKLLNKIGDALGKDWNLNADWAKIPKIPRIPYLATGAVLPGGSPMLAWVNDQPKGQPYIEGSIENIAAAFKEYLGGSNFGNQNITIEANGNWAQFIKWMNLQIKQEGNRASIWG